MATVSLPMSLERYAELLVEEHDSKLRCFRAKARFWFRYRGDYRNARVLQPGSVTISIRPILFEPLPQA